VVCRLNLLKANSAGGRYNSQDHFERILAMEEGVSTIGLVVVFFGILGIYAVSILFVAWLFSLAFRVKAFLRVSGQIRDELKALNDYNSGRNS